MAINTVSPTNSATPHSQTPTGAKTKPNADFSKVMANASAPAPKAPEVKETSTSSTLQSGDSNKATA